MPPVAPILLVGSIGFRNEEEVFRAPAGSLGARARRYPDGETGERHCRIRWQRKVFEDNPDLMVVDDGEGYRKTRR